jgi:hypothetical protein
MNEEWFVRTALIPNKRTCWYRGMSDVISHESDEFFFKEPKSEVCSPESTSFDQLPTQQSDEAEVTVNCLAREQRSALERFCSNEKVGS